MQRILLVLLLASFLYACDEAGSKIKKSNISGYSYKHFIANQDGPGNVGDQVYFKMDILDDRDSVLQENLDSKNFPNIKIVDQTDPTRKKNPIVDILSMLSAGDSAAILVPVDSVQGMPPGLEYIKHLEYHVVVKEILTEAEHKAKLATAAEEQKARMEELRSVLPEIESLTEETLSSYKEGSLQLEETPGGVKYIFHEKGTGQLPSQDRLVTMQYFGRTVSTGKSFDNSFIRGKGYTFRVGRDAVIQGWHDVTPFLPVGSKASVFIPSPLGYGETGSPPDIPANAELYFYLEVEEMLY